MPQTLSQSAHDFKPGFARMPVGIPNTTQVHGCFEYADLTATSTVATNGNGDFQTNQTNFRAVINLKTFVAGTAASSFAIEAADNEAMTQNVRRAAAQVVPGVACTMILEGFVPDGGKRYARVAVTFGSGASGTFDAFLMACP